jgi:hypothetical protein
LALTLWLLRTSSVPCQAIKTTLNYLQETNGELHFFLHNYFAQHPLVVDPGVDADEWLVSAEGGFVGRHWHRDPDQPLVSPHRSRKVRTGLQ